MMRWIAVFLLCGALAAQAADERANRKAGSRQPVQTSKCNEVPSRPFDLILARPTSRSATVSVLCHEDAQGCIAYGTQAGKLTDKTATQAFRKGEPVEMVLSPLQADTQYFYQLRLAGSNSGEFTFHTARPANSSFTFTITADSHLDEQTDPNVYLRTLDNALADKPDFHVDLGDTFMTEKHATRDDAAGQYLAQRYYFDRLCRSAPLMLVLGNHDGESPRGRGSDADGLAVWSNMMRKRYFPNPVPDGFYTGNAAKHPQAGLLQDYYAWEWGDALFVVLDPFWFAQKQRGKGDNWKRTLGEEQYQWLKRTLEGSKAKFKFVFIHHLVGGADEQARGGSEAAVLYEWGGKNPDGSDGFKQNRPGWPAPIHQLLVQNRVNVVFHGHDHFYARQELDGVVYQEVPQPGYPGSGKAPRSAAEYGYTHGTILGSSGHLRVAITPAKATVEYVRADRSIAHSYVIPSESRISASAIDFTTPVEKLAADFTFTEGPVWIAAKNELLFSDIPANRIVRFKDGKFTTFRTPSNNSNGLTLDKQGRLIACEHGLRRVTRTESDGNVVVLAERHEGKRFNSPNDVVVKRDGAIYFTDPPYGVKREDRELDFQGVYRIAPDGKTLALLARDFVKPNGLAFTPDEKTLYVNDTERGQIRAFDVAADGTIANGRVFAQAPGADGMKVDTEGNIYCACKTGVMVFDSAGKHLGTFATPEQPTNCAFGGDDWKTLYVTCRTSVYYVRLAIPGIKLP